jgi:predicted PurR-regulated permease PerM
MPTLTDKKTALRIVHAIEGEVSRYLLTITAINCCLGLLVGASMGLLGMPQPALWGIAAGLLNFIPYIGAAAGILAVAAVAIVTFPTLAAAAMPPLAYLILNVIENNLVTPLVLGRRLELNAVVILVALAFWGWMWGIVGTFVAVPLLVVTKVFCDHFPALHNFGEFLSGQPSQADASEDAEVSDAPKD